jgi:hypothetical protein
MDEMVKSIDAMSREQLHLLVQQMGLQAVTLPVFLPGEPGTPTTCEWTEECVPNLTKSGLMEPDMWLYNYLPR